MARSIRVSFIDWEEFHGRFEGVDWTSINEDTDEPISVDLFCGEEESLDLSGGEAWRAGEALDALHCAIAQFPLQSEVTAFWRRVFPWPLKSQPMPEPRLVPFENNPKLLRDMLRWIEDAEFVFRLSPLPYRNASERFQDSSIDFSYFRSEGMDIDTVSPTSIIAIFQRLPSPLLETFPELRLKIEGGQSDEYFGDVEYSLHFWRDVVEKAEEGRKGLFISCG